jgi:fibronectin type 3 domain-containing protein
MRRNRGRVSAAARLAGLLLLLGLLTPLPAADAASVCGEFDSPSGYHVTVCIDQPVAGSTLSGDATVQATVRTSGMPSGTRVQAVVFCRDHWPCTRRSDGYLITDWSGEADGAGGKSYVFRLDTTRYLDTSQTTLYAYAEINDGSTSPAGSADVAFDNGVHSTPPLPTGFAAHVPQAEPGLVVGAVGDGAGGEPAESNVAALVQSWNPGLFLYLGDVYDKGSPEEFDNWYDRFGYGALRSVTNPTVGNHEYSADQNADGYFGYWRSPPHYYSYDGGGWHFVSLDSTSQFNTARPGVLQDEPGTVASPTQYDWLAADLASHADACTIVYFHHPVFNQGEEGAADRMRSIWSLLASSHVTAVLTGHDHDYQRFTPLDGSGSEDARGVTEFVVGGGGHSTQQVVPGSQPGPDPVEYATGFAAMRMELHPDRVDYAAVAPDGTSRGKVLDSGSIPCQGLDRDTTRPTPASVTATTSLQNNLPRVDLGWTPAHDDRGVASYAVLRDGVVIETTLPGTATAYTDNSVQTGHDYTYVVRASDAWGNTADSAPVAVRTPDQTAAPTDAPLLADTYVASTSPAPKGSADRLRVVQSSSGTNIAYLKFDLRQFSGTVRSATLTMTPASNTSAKATARAVADSSWTESGLGWPGPALGSAGGTTQAALQTDVPIGLDVTTLLTPGEVNSLALVETSGTTTQSYYSKEASTPAAPRLTITMAVPPDSTSPTRPTGLSATPQGENEIDLAWQPSTDNVAVDHYEIYRESEPYDEVPAATTSYADVVVGAGQTWHYTVTAVDHAGNASPPSASAVATTPDLSAPDAVEDPVALATSATTAILTWEGADDNVAVTGFTVYRNGVAIGLAGAADRKYSDKGLQPETTYTYSISAFDAAGNASVPGSATANPITTPAASLDTKPPTVPQHLSALVTSGTSVQLSWDPSTDNVAVAGYTVFEDGEPAYSSTSNTFEVTGLASPSTHTWAVDAVDSSGNHSQTSTSIVVSTPDDVPPAAPASLSVAATSYREVALSWQAATDNVGVTRYAVYRDGSLLGRVADTSFTDQGASPATSYVYAVAAEDAASNQSALTTASFTTPAVRTDDSGWLTVNDSGYVQSGSSADTNYKYATILRVTGGTTQKVSYLKVSVPATVLPTVDHLYLQLTTQDAQNPGFEVHLVPSNAWDRSTLTWNNQPGWAADVVGSSGKVTQAGTVPTPPGTLDLRSAIAGPGTYTFALLSTSSQSQTYESTYTSVPSAERPRVRWLSHD